MFLYSNWRQLPLSVRNEIAQKFGIAKTGPTHVVDNRIESDGYKIESVESALNIDAIQAFTGSDSTDMALLWELMLAKVEGRELPTLQPHVVIEEEAEVLVIVPSTETVEVKPVKKATRKTKK